MLRLELIAPYGHIFNVQCKAVTLPGADGELQALSGHTPMLMGLKTGLLTCELADNEAIPPNVLSEEQFDRWGHRRYFYLLVLGGFAQIDNDNICVLSDAVALPSELDHSNEETMQEKLQQRIAKLQLENEKTLDTHSAELKSALSKLKI